MQHERMMQCVVPALSAIAALTAAAGSPRRPWLRVCVSGFVRAGCFSTLKAAVGAAHDGDTIAIAPGTFAGGVTIDVSVMWWEPGPGRRRSPAAGPC